MKVALVHYWLLNMRGGEKVLEALCELFPDADIFTHVYAPERVSATFKRHCVRTTFISRLPFAMSLYQNYLPLMPLALEQLDLREYDLVISSESGPAKGVLTRPDALHLCYCHSPMRYVWSMYQDYRKATSFLSRMLMPWLIHRLRIWDFQSAGRVDTFVANSHNVAKQVWHYYRREATVLYPPVDTEAFDADAPRENFYLYVGELTRYKRADLAVEAFTKAGKPLILIGDGTEARALKRMAGPTITFLGRQPFAVLRKHYARCRALVFPGEEDFGIVPVEAMASGAPVIAFGRGGALETVVSGKTGVFFDAQTQGSLLAGVKTFEETEHLFHRENIVAHSRQFSKGIFKSRFLDLLEAALAGTTWHNLGLILPHKIEDRVEPILASVAK